VAYVVGDQGTWEENGLKGDTNGKIQILTKIIRGKWEQESKTYRGKKSSGGGDRGFNTSLVEGGG